MNTKELMPTVIGDYDPHMHRVIEHPISNVEAFISLVKCAIGTGCLAMPMAFSKAGWLNGIISCILIGAIMIYSLHILLRGIYVMCQRLHVPQLSYASALEYGLREGPQYLHFMSVPLGFLVDFYMALYHFGVCCVYIIFIAENIKQIVDFYLQLQIDSRLYMCVLAPLLTLLVLVRDLKHLVPFTIAANILFFCGFSVLLYYILIALPPLNERQTFASIYTYPIFFGTVLFAIESIGVLMAIEENMASPKDFLGFTGILNKGMLTVVMMYAIFGFLGYWRYGSNVQDSITLNLPHDSILPQLSKAFFAISIFLSYALQGYVSMDVIWNHRLAAMIEPEKQRPTQCLVRLLLVFSSVFCAVSVPNLGPFLSLVGSLCLSFLCLILPALLDICVKFKTGYGRMRVYLVKDVLLIIFGVVGGLSGSWVAIHHILHQFEFIF